MNRREFLALGAGFAAAGAVCGGRALAVDSGLAPAVALPRPRFAPHVGTFRHLAGDDPVDQIRCAADHGFAGFEDLPLATRPWRVQERMAAELDRHGMELGAFLGWSDFALPAFASGRAEERRRVLRAMEHAASCARATNARWCLIVPGRAAASLPALRQRANVVALLRECVELCADAGLGVLIEPLELGSSRLPLAVAGFADAVALCDAVGSPRCRVLCDLYALSMTGTAAGDPIRRTSDVLAAIAPAWDRVGYVQWGDAPGRKEPGTGGVDFREIIWFLGAHGYRGLIGMEHGHSQPGAEGELAVINAYHRLST